MSFWARTLPTPGSDSRTADTFIFPTVSSVDRISTSPNVRFPDFSSPLSSARFFRASAAFARACARCSGVRTGSGMPLLLLFGGRCRCL